MSNKEAFDFQQWLLKYFSLGLECDVPILEALYFTPPYLILCAWKAEFWRLFHEQQFTQAQKLWKYIWHSPPASLAVLWFGMRAQLNLTDQHTDLIWKDINSQPISYPEQFTKFLAEVTKPRAAKRDASPERH
jgi:hypothetical protein